MGGVDCRAALNPECLPWQGKFTTQPVGVCIVPVKVFRGIVRTKNPSAEVKGTFVDFEFFLFFVGKLPVCRIGGRGEGALQVGGMTRIHEGRSHTHRLEGAGILESYTRRHTDHVRYTSYPVVDG
ncbi:hypothetical protein KE639_01231 [Streptomyces sp. V17-9]|nr:hypothetical protein KE639_01231 [Streptomyces sp. V17-9]